MNDLRRIGLVAVLLSIFPFLFGASSYFMRTAIIVLVFAILAVALNVAFGHTNQLFLFVGGLAGAGAYTVALTADAVGVPGWVTLPLGMAFCAAIAALVSYVAAKRKFTVILISILTLNLQLAFVEFFVGARSITGGSTGFAFEGLLLDEIGEAIGFDSLVLLYFLLVIALAAVLVGYVRLIDSRFGLAFEAIREDEVAAESIGLDVVRYKTIAGALAGALIGFAGVMYVGMEGYVTPSLFRFLHVDVVVLIMLIVGGLRTTFGPVAGAALIVVIREVLSVSTQYQTAFFGALLVVLFLYFRSGIVPALEEILGQYDRPTRGSEREGADERPGE